MFESLDEKVRGKHCDGIAGIIEEGKSIMEEDFDETTMDACLIAAGQRAEHYEMAAYGTLVAWAQAMGHTEAAKLLQQTLDEEKAADKKLSGLAEGGINQGAADAAHADEDEPVGAAASSARKTRRRPVAGSATPGRGRHGADSAAVADERRGKLTAWRRSPRRGGSWRNDSTVATATGGDASIATATRNGGHVDAGAFAKRAFMCAPCPWNCWTRRSMSKPFAIVTGASSGIGLELAAICAQEGFDLLVAADRPEIQAAADRFRGLGADVTVVETDLATTAGVDQLWAAAAGRPVDALLANAGHGLGRAFLDQDFDGRASRHRHQRDRHGVSGAAGRAGHAQPRDRDASC